MSFWTHIVGVMHVETYQEVDDIKAYAEESLKEAPLITGSESDAAIFVNPEPGHNISTSADCARCEFGKTARAEDGYWVCDAEDDYHCPHGDYQSRVVITVYGDLRDRMRKQTKKEWNEFHRYVAKKLKWTIRNAACRIEGY